VAKTLPHFERDEASPKLDPNAGGIVIAAADGRIAEVTLRGAFRMLAADRAGLAAAPLRGQVWVVAIERDLRSCHLGRPGADAMVFAEEEPKAGPVEGWFNISLAECCKLPKQRGGTYDVTAMIGPYKSAVVTLKLRL
jgi:hypothetical protein